MVDFGEVVLDCLFHAVFEGHLGVGAGAARALETHLDDILGGEFHKFDVAAVLH